MFYAPYFSTMAEVRLLAYRFVEKFVFECSCFFPVVGVLAIVGLRRFFGHDAFLRERSNLCAFKRAPFSGDC